MTRDRKDLLKVLTIFFLGFVAIIVGVTLSQGVPSGFVIGGVLLVMLGILAFTGLCVSKTEE
jgi:uncharacterized membrane protein